MTFILGGARSGKSTYAERIARELGGDSVLYVATSESGDAEMEQRIEKHRANRSTTWSTLEVPTGVARALLARGDDAKVVLLDCVTFLVANHLMLAAGPQEDPFADLSGDPFDARIEADVVEEIEALVAFIQERPVEAIVVSNEVGLGVVPPYELGRAYRDILGRANQILASHADEVMLLVAGIPMKVK